MSLVVARKESHPGSASGPEKATASVSPRKDTGSPRNIKRGPPVAKKPSRDSLPDSPRLVGPKKPPRLHLQNGSPVSPRKQPVKPVVAEPEVQVVNQSSPDAVGKAYVSLLCFGTGSFGL